MTLRNMTINFQVLSGSGPMPVAHICWKHSWSMWDGHHFQDMTKRNHREAVGPLGQPDLYVCGFPCPTCSSAGKHSGVSTPHGATPLSYVCLPPSCQAKSCRAGERRRLAEIAQESVSISSEAVASFAVCFMSPGIDFQPLRHSPEP